MIDRDTLRRIVIEEPCEHGKAAYCGYMAGWNEERNKPNRCPGGSRLVVEGREVWLCIEQEQRGLAVSNLPGGWNHCYFTGKSKHLSACGRMILIDGNTE